MTTESLEPEDLPMPDFTQVDTVPVPAEDIPDHIEEVGTDVQVSHADE